MGIQRRISLSIKSASILQNRKRIYEHLFTKCDFSNNFWQDLINSFNMRDIKVEALSEIDKIFGLWKRQADFHLLDHFFILAKHHIYFCRNKGYPPSLKIYLAKQPQSYQIGSLQFQSVLDKQNIATIYEYYKVSVIFFALVFPIYKNLYNVYFLQVVYLVQKTFVTEL